MTEELPVDSMIQDKREESAKRCRCGRPTYIKPWKKTRHCFECYREKARSRDAIYKASDKYKNRITYCRCGKQAASYQSHKCKECNAAYLKEWYQRNPLYSQKWFAAHPGVQAEANRKYNRTEKGKLRDIKRRQRSPEKSKARSLFNQTVLDGKIKRQPCEVCGAINVHGHHTDYSKPYDVKWLCRKHHDEEHARLRRAEKAPFLTP